MKLNLNIKGFYPGIASRIFGRDPALDAQVNPHTIFTNGVIDKALFKILPPEEAHEIIHGYRRSAWNENALKKDIDKLNSPEHPVPKDEHYWNAINHIAKLLRPDTPLLPVHFADLPRYKWRLSTNVGAPYNISKDWQDYVKAKFNFQQKGIPFENRAHRDLFVEAHQTSEPLTISDTRMTKHNLYSEIFFNTREKIHRIKAGHTHSKTGHDLRYWNTAFARQHLVKQDEDDKVRLVFGAPFTLLTAELMFIWPLQVFLLTMKGSTAFMLWGFETILGGWYRLRNFFSKYAPRHDTIVTLDWSGFDRYARHTVIHDIHHKILRPLFSFRDGYHPTTTNPSYPEADVIEGKLENLWNWMTDAVLTIPLLMPDGTMYEFRHSGIFSGYFQTQILDSLYNLVMIFTILSRMGFDLDKVVIKVQGDDSIFVLLCCFILIAHSFLTMFKFYASHYFGAVVNDKKSEIRDTLQDAEVLKYKNRNGIPYRDRISLLAQLRHPERSTRPEDVAARCVGIAIMTCGQDPLAFAVCEDIWTFLVKTKGITPNENELRKMLDNILDGAPSRPRYSAAHFPSYLSTMDHLLEGERPLAKHHWPQDYFIGLPGR